MLFVKFDQLFLMVFFWGGGVGLKSLFSYLNLNYVFVLIFREVSVRVFFSTMLKSKKKQQQQLSFFVE